MRGERSWFSFRTIFFMILLSAVLFFAYFRVEFAELIGDVWSGLGPEKLGVATGKPVSYRLVGESGLLNRARLRVVSFTSSNVGENEVSIMCELLNEGGETSIYPTLVVNTFNDRGERMRGISLHPGQYSHKSLLSGQEDVRFTFKKLTEETSFTVGIS
jgi:hypothetical protein